MCDAASYFGALTTIIAASVAAFFVHKQVAIARMQANTAIDQLKCSVFEKRYAIYCEARGLIKKLLNDSHKPNFSASDIIPHLVIFDEAAFFFSDEICKWLKEIEKECVTLLGLKHAEDAHAYAEQQKRLTGHLREMPPRFREELGFRQLMGRTT